MASDGAWEIPPLDDAPDIARTAEPQPGETIGDARNWAGFVLVGIGLSAVVLTIAIAALGADGGALFAAVVAGAALLTGTGLLLFERRNRRARQQDSSNEQQPAAW
ncbi:hypothetical protein [Nocardia amikacinitolerans]|uniref:hypothetical protein n=1 Tax=Nocardia amikacinitolerans TaxID=756689 RepID=UPI0020A26DEF|nr:hypothetical protein [Nocardia amikacinitolerans]MCP2275105.1 hypothetical protein [Nocardia amikacinitolerans]MCP2296155.1 hypothetical protein [Nocardia amikacinitolerans]